MKNNNKLELGPRCTRLIEYWATLYADDPTEALSAEEWKTLLAAIGLSMLATKAGDDEAVAECVMIVSEAALRTGLPIQFATLS